MSHYQGFYGPKCQLFGIVGKIYAHGWPCKLLLLLLLYSSSDRMYHYRANNVYSLNQSKRKDGIGREAKEEVVFVLATSKPGDFSVFPVLKLD